MNVRSALAPLAPLVLLAVACTPPEPPPALPPPPTPTVTAPPAPATDEPAPALHLPADVHPTAESVELRIDPAADRFSGVVDVSVTLDRPRAVVWLHGKGLHVTRATVTPAGGAELAATWEQRHESGVASITAPSPVSGAVKIHVEYDAPLNQSPEGLYRTSEGGVPYAFTQFEAVAARTAFPCFDEPGFKIPWSESLVVPKGAQAIANTREIGRTDEGTWTRVRFAETLPLPSYLTAFAVGPLDVVEVAAVPPNAVRSRPVPLRGVAPKGRGKEMAYALAHTGELLARLEGYFGLEYPYDKLDILAVPDKGGAMENAGAVTFAELLVLMDEKTAPIRQLRAYAIVMTHELAHQWVGDLVTAAWWDDIWLNESFAEWIAAKIADTWSAKVEARMALLEGVQGAMGADALVSARSIRQPIASMDDIENAFDSITYEKGGGVLAMFERWIGKETFQRGVNAYLKERAFKAGTADDLLGALSAAAGKDVKTPFHTFLDQPGVPFVEAEVRCDGAPRLHLRQSRYLPLGSSGDAGHTWQIPICARAGTGKGKGAKVVDACTLLTEREGDLPLGSACPAWVFPNADASGYLRFSLAAPDLAKLRKAGLAALSDREKIAYGNSLRAALNRGTLPFGDVLEAAAPLAGSCAAPDRGLRADGHTLRHRPRVAPRRPAPGRRRGVRAAHVPRALRAARLGREEDGRRRARGAAHLGARLHGGLGEGPRRARRGAEARRRLPRLREGRRDPPRGGRPEPPRRRLRRHRRGRGAAPLGRDARAPSARPRTTSSGAASSRRALASGEGRAAAAARARDLALDPALHTTEVMTPIAVQMSQPETREATWQWIQEHYDAFLGHVSQHHGRPRVFSLPGAFCDEAHLADVERFLAPRAPSIEGAPRVLASTLEHIRLCIAERRAEEPGVRAFFGKKGR